VYLQGKQKTNLWGSWPICVRF